jgi:hypothetical protein
VAIISDERFLGLDMCGVVAMSGGKKILIVIARPEANIYAGPDAGIFPKMEL